MSAVITRSIPPRRLVDGINPLVRALARSRLHATVDGALLLLHVTGRRSGRSLDIPVGFAALDDERLVVVTQHTWRANLRGGADLEVTRNGRRERMRASLDEDPATVAATLRTLVERIGPRGARQRLGLRITGGELPSAAELETAVREYDLATVTLSPLGVTARPDRIEG
jgi:hypothetical protein